MRELERIALRRRGTVMMAANKEYEQTGMEKRMVVAIAKNVESLGFAFKPECVNEVLLHMERKELENLYEWLIPALKELVGADVEYDPMYPNFPSQVANMDDAELFVNAIIHYLTFGQLVPKYEKKERLPLIDTTNFRVLTVGTYEDIMEIFNNLVCSKTSLSVQDKEDVETIIKNCDDITAILPDEIPLKENVALIVNILIKNASTESVRAVKKYFRTATDVLRLVVAMSDGDISLARKCRFKKMKRYERRMILALLENCGNIVEDMWAYREEWLRIGEIIHPGEFKGEYANAREAFRQIRNERKPLMFAGKVHDAVVNGRTRDAVRLLSERPGEFARRLDKVLRDASSYDDKEFVAREFGKVAEQVSTVVLLQLRKHFVERMENNNPIRVFFPKGNLAKATSIKNELPEIPAAVCRYVMNVCGDAILKQYKTRDGMGRVYIDPEFKNFVAPFSQRSASKAAKTIVRGSQLPISEDAKVVRGFIWWTNARKDSSDHWNDRSRVDIDLSAAIYDENWRYIDHVSYTRLRSGKYNAYHSGDLTNGGDINGKGVAEFLDVDIDAVARDGRYIVYQVYSFTGQKFSELPNCRFGWMEREDVNSGEIFEPTTVEMKIDLTADGGTAIPVIFDCKERKFIWCDMNLGIEHSYYYGKNLESNLSGVSATCYAMCHLNKASIYDVVLFNALARGSVVEDRNNADIIFSNDQTVPLETVIETDDSTGITKEVIREKNVPIITAFDVDYFMNML